MVFKTVKVNDFNEITAFMLEVLSTNEYAEKTTKVKIAFLQKIILCFTHLNKFTW